MNLSNRIHLCVKEYTIVASGSWEVVDPWTLCGLGDDTLPSGDTWAGRLTTVTCDACILLALKVPYCRETSRAEDEEDRKVLDDF